MNRKGLFVDPDFFLNKDMRQVCVDKLSGHFTKYTDDGCTLRPGLKGKVSLYCVTKLNDGTLLAFSDEYQTRYYLVQPKKLKRVSVIIDKPSDTFTSVWENLFVALCGNTSSRGIYFYNSLSYLFKEHLVTGGVERSFNIDGIYEGKQFLASVRFSSDKPNSVAVSSTMDNIYSRDMLILYHPLEAYSRACSK